VDRIERILRPDEPGALMPLPLRRRHTRFGAVIAVALGGLVWSGSALGVGEPTGLSASPSGTTQSRTISFSWGAPDDAPAGLLFTGSYVGGLHADGQPAPDGGVSPGAVDGIGDGRYDFTVRAVFSDGVTTVAGDPAVISNIVVDDTNPQVTGVGLFGARTPWGFRSLTLVPNCTDNLTGVVAGCEEREWTDDGSYPGVAFAPVDGAGNVGAGSSAAFNYDGTLPEAGQPSNPGRLVADEPLFEWTRGVDETSDIDRYELQYRTATPSGSPWKLIARVAHVPSSVQDFYGARRDEALHPDPLPLRELLKWRVRTFDRAGNISVSGESEVTIDPTVPEAPTITGGPTAPTRISSPTFSWQGQYQTFRWDLTVTGSVTPIRSGGGVQTQATLRDLPDGDYTFRVSQVTDAGRPSAEATRSFRVDTTPPAPPSILVRPPFPAIAPPVFTWAVEPGAYSRWTVLGEGGASVIASTDTPTTTVTLPALADGAYSFQVRQVDAAGNVSAPTAEPFSMLAPLVPAPSPSTTASIAKTLPRQNAIRLKPKAGKIIPTRSPVLQWRKGPRGTRLYNLQLFRVTARKGARPRISKVLSTFPRGLQYRAPRKNLRPGTCYVWRVWPYTGRAFTPKPVGVSNFCVASAKVVRKKEAAARAKRLEAAARRSRR
jgi:hypothetical protein